MVEEKYKAYPVWEKEDVQKNSSISIPKLIFRPLNGNLFLEYFIQVNRWGYSHFYNNKVFPVDFNFQIAVPKSACFYR